MSEAGNSLARRTRSGKLRVHVMHKADAALWVVVGALVAVTVFAMIIMDYGKVNFLDACVAALGDFWEMMSTPGLAGHFTAEDVIVGLFESLALAALTTFIGAVIAFVFGLFAAVNLSNKAASNVIKILMSIFRAVPTILWVLVFSVAIGLGPEAAVAGLLFHSIAYLVKAYSEAFEEIDPGTLEALRGGRGRHRLPAVPGRQLLSEPARGGTHRVSVPCRRRGAGDYRHPAAQALHRSAVTPDSDCVQASFGP